MFFHCGERVFFFFSLVCENAKRAAAYNGGVMVEAVRGVSVKDTLGSASRRTGRWGSFVFLTALHVGMHKKPHVENECHETRHEPTSSSH